MDYETSVEIDASAVRVWEVLVDIRRWPEWSDSTTSVEPLFEGELQVGSTAKVKQPRMQTLTWRVTELERGASFVWVTKAAGVTVTAGHYLTETATGTTARLTTHTEGLLAGVVAALTGKQSRRYVDMEAAGAETQERASGLARPDPTPPSRHPVNGLRSHPT